MTRIYEALELANLQRQKQAPPASSKGPEQRVPVDEPRPFETRIDQALIALHHNLVSLLPGKQGRTIQFVSAEKGEGTSVLIREFAKVAALNLRKSVLLLDADQHKPTHIQKFSLKQNEGWDTVLNEGDRIESVLGQVKGSSLSVSQLIMQNSLEPPLYESLQFKGLLDRLKENFELILVDSPPFTEYSDALTLSSKVDGVVLVVAAEETRWQAVQNMKERIAMIGGNVLGVVLNKRKYYIPEPIYRLL